MSFIFTYFLNFPWFFFPLCFSKPQFFLNLRAYNAVTDFRTPYFSRILDSCASSYPMKSSIFIVAKVSDSWMTTITWSKWGVSLFITFSITIFLTITPPYSSYYAPNLEPLMHRQQMFNVAIHTTLFEIPLFPFSPPL